MTTARLLRGMHLLNLGRTAEAEREFRAALAEDAGDPQAHALLARCLLERKEYDEATREAETAVGLAPDAADVHFALAQVWRERQYPDRAARSADEAIRLDPENADYYAFRALLYFEAGRWNEALTAAETGLRCNSEHVACNNFRAMALVKLGRRSEAGQTIDAALARDPEDAFSHANKGWALLEARKPQEAMLHFREALRLDPTMEYARVGIVEALKARNPIYALFLRYMLWMLKLPSQTQWAIVIGGYFGQKFLGNLADNNPALAPVLYVIIIAYIVFAIFTWLARPVFNLLLRLHPFGRLALSTEEIRETNWIGGYFLAAILCFGLSFIPDWWVILRLPSLWIALSTMPLFLVFRCAEGWPRTTMICVVAALGILTIMWPAAIYTAEFDTAEQLASVFWMIFIGSIWGGQLIAGARVRR
ncbi:MAG: tetratricopeptide repeat protein [Planctomycetia bacterium]|nr:tetratricopeptide repeat protein [Planctomycetia bacterium]